MAPQMFATADSRSQVVVAFRSHLKELMSQYEFHEAIAKMVGDLRAAGHVLTSYDWDDDLEVWGRPPGSVGLIFEVRGSGGDDWSCEFWWK